jgi:phage gp46-like protein
MQFFLNGRHQATLSDFDTEPLVRSIIISLFSWKRAGEDDVLPGKSRMGWWADSYNDDEPPIGSKLWLLSREVLV